MRSIPPLIFLLLTVSPVFGLGKELDYQEQMDQYGSIFAFACGGALIIGLILFVYHVIRGMKAEHSRGKRPIPFREQILDEKPKKQGPLFMGEKVPDWKIDNRLKATSAALKFLKTTDKRFNKKKLLAITEEAFVLVKAAIAGRSTKKIETVVVVELLEELREEVKSLHKKKRLHVFGKLEVTGVEIVHINVPASKKDHTYTALITAKSKDYFQNDETGQVVRGDKKTYYYQEFWTFRRFKEGWLVERMRPSGDMDRILEGKNILTEATLTEFTKVADPEVLREFVAK